MKPKIKIAIMSDPMDRRPERAFAPKRLVEGLLKDPDFEVYLVHYKKMSDEPLYEKVHEILIPLLPLPWGSHFFSFIWFCLRTKEKFDIVHWLLPRVFPFFWFFPAKKVVVTAHDGYVGFWTFANMIFWFTLTFFNRYLHAVIGVSEYAKKEIMETYHIPKSRAYVVHNGVDSVYRHLSCNLASDVLKKYNISTDKYFLYIGGMQPHKNVKRLVEAYILLRDTEANINNKLVIVGKTSFGDEVLKIMKETKYSADIIHAGFVPLEDLSAFYSSAISLIFVSLQEGCGMPIIEAMACGIPVITSNVSAMPETAGGAALLVNPQSSEEIMKGMKRIAQDEPLRKDLIEKGYKRASLLTWERFVKENLEIYKKILSNQ